MSVVTIAVYRSVTGDETTASGTVQTWLDDTEQDLEEYLDRPLPLGTYTAERCKINNERRGPTVYPRATPLSDGVSCPVTDDGQVVGEIQGRLKAKEILRSVLG